MTQLVLHEDERVCRWVYEKTGGIFGPGCVGVGLARDGRLDCGVAYDGFNGANILMHQRIDGPPTREFIWFTFWYPFEQLRVKRITGVVPSNNRPARDLVKHLGFTFEHAMKDAHPQGDLHIFRMFRNECRFLEWIPRDEQVTTA